MPAACPNCGSKESTFLRSHGPLQIVHHRLCRACGETYAPQNFLARVLAFAFGILWVVVGSSWLVLDFRRRSLSAWLFCWWTATIGMGVGLIYEAITCRKRYPAPRGFPVER